MCRLEKTGLGMGSPISPVLACIYMEHFEKDLIPTGTNVNGYVWKRYVDDVLIV